MRCRASSGWACVCVLAAAAVTAGPEQAGDWSCRAAARALGGWLAAMPALRAQPRLRSAAWLVCMRLRLRPAPAAACAPSLFVSPLNAVRVKGAIRARAPADGSRWLAAFSPGPNPPSRATGGRAPPLAVRRPRRGRRWCHAHSHPTIAVVLCDHCTCIACCCTLFVSVEAVGHGATRL